MRKTSCPPIDALAAHVDLPPANPRRIKAEEHLASCADCRMELRLARNFEAGIMRRDEADDVNWIASQLRRPPVEVRESAWRRLFAPRFAMPLAAAAAVLLTVFGVVVQSHSAPNRLNGPELRDEVFRSSTVELLGPSGDLTETPAKFEWKPFAGAASYELRVSEVDLTTVMQMNTPRTSVTMPARVANVLVPGKPLLWVVTAKDAAGREIATSGAERFRIVPNGGL